MNKVSSLSVVIIVVHIIIGFRNRLTDPTPGDLTSCMMFVERTLPIALARPFVERLVPEGTKVSIYCNYRSTLVLRS